MVSAGEMGCNNQNKVSHSMYNPIYTEVFLMCFFILSKFWDFVACFLFVSLIYKTQNYSKMEKIYNRRKHNSSVLLAPSQVLNRLK